MIKFIPAHERDFQYAEQELAFCEHMNTSDPRLRCIKRDCRGITTEIRVAAKDANDFQFNIENCCCEEFRTRMDSILNLE